MGILSSAGRKSTLHIKPIIETEPVLVLDRVFRGYAQGAEKLDVLRGAELAIGPGEMVALVGPSGAGKTTLLQLAGLLEKPDAGHVVIEGEICEKLGEAERTALRRQKIGFVYQFHHLLAEFSAIENVVLPQMIAGKKRGQAVHDGNELLRQVGLAARASHRPGLLSGGEQQRVAIARALANAPRLLLADEPTGNLDPHTAGQVFETLLKVVRGTGTAALIATHNMALAAKMDRIIALDGGELRETAAG